MLNFNLIAIELSNDFYKIFKNKDLYEFSLSLLRECFFLKSKELNNYDLDIYMDIFKNNFNQMINSESLMITFNVLFNKKIEEITSIKLNRIFKNINYINDEIILINELNENNKEKIINYIKSFEFNYFLKNIVLIIVDETSKNADNELLLLDKSYKESLSKDIIINKQKKW